MTSLQQAQRKVISLSYQIMEHIDQYLASSAYKCILYLIGKFSMILLCHIINSDTNFLPKRFQCTKLILAIIAMLEQSTQQSPLLNTSFWIFVTIVGQGL